ncbi:MAG: IS6 family transposase [Gammaproteobacteria bacterium]|nr:IS6 family transposase [Gammaproteobacteria bacterium]
MKPKNNLYSGHRYPKDIISHVVWLYHRFTLSYRDIEDILAYRGIQVTYESICQWCLKFGKTYAKKLRNQYGKKSDCWFLDEVFIKIRGKMHYLWRAVDQDGDVIDILVQKRKDKKAAQRFFKKLLKAQERTPYKLMTDKLKSYGLAKEELMPSVTHIQARYSNNREENSHQRTRQQERQMRGFKSHKQAQLFLSVHGQINNLFNLGRHLMRAENYRFFRFRAFNEWSEMTCA